MGMMSDLHLDQERIERLNPSFSQRAAVAKLIGYCEAICASGLVGDLMERQLRVHVAETLTAFGMSHHTQQYDNDLEVIRQCMEKTR